MLLKRVTLDAIANADIDLVFRRWKRPTVKSGGTLRTSVGMLDIVSVERTTMAEVTPGDALRAGFDTKTELLRSLRGRDGDLYRITVRLGGKDPLIALRSRVEFTEGELADLRAKLSRMDESADDGPWTTRYLEMLLAEPHTRAEDLAYSIGLDKPVFKGRVRRLKALGLTISHSPGYELSPRGRALLDRTD